MLHHENKFDASKSRQRRETTICRAAALHPLGYESIRLCATFWDTYCCVFTALSTNVKQLIKVYARWVKSWRQNVYLMSVIDGLTHQSGTTRSEYYVKRVIRNKSVYEIDTDILGFSFLRLILLRYDTCKWRTVAAICTLCDGFTEIFSVDILKQFHRNTCQKLQKFENLVYMPHQKLIWYDSRRKLRHFGVFLPSSPMFTEHPSFYFACSL